MRPWFFTHALSMSCSQDTCTNTIAAAAAVATKNGCDLRGSVTVTLRALCGATGQPFGWSEVCVHLRRWAELDPSHPPKWLDSVPVFKSEFLRDTSAGDLDAALSAPELLARWEGKCNRQTAAAVAADRWFVVGSEFSCAVDPKVSRKDTVLEFERIKTSLSVLLPAGTLPSE